MGTAGTAKKHGVPEQIVFNWRKQVQDVLAGRVQGPSAGVGTDVCGPVAADGVQAAGVFAVDAGGAEGADVAKALG